MCNEANLLSEVVSDTWLEAESPLVAVVIHVAVVNHSVRETTVNEESEVTSLSELVTNVWVDSESVAVHVIEHAIEVFEIVASCIVVTIAISVSKTDSHCDVELVVDSVTNLRKKVEVSGCAELFTVDRSLSCAETNFATDPNLCVSCERSNCYESCK